MNFPVSRRVNYYVDHINDHKRIFSYKSCENKNDFDTDFTTRTLDRGWTPENIKCILILHPKKVEELNHNYVKDNKQVDENGKFKFYFWK